jgi:hypothetical protein
MSVGTRRGCPTKNAGEKSCGTAYPFESFDQLLHLGNLKLGSILTVNNSADSKKLVQGPCRNVGEGGIG